jgi:hypothetical protein
LSAPISSRVRSLSLCPWARSVNIDRPFAYAPSLARGSHLSDTSPSLTSRPRTPSWTRPHRAFSGHSPTCPTYFWSPHSLAHSPRSVAPPTDPSHLSLAPCAHPWSTTIVHRPVRGRRRAPVTSIALMNSASSPATRDTLWFAPSPSISLGSRSPNFSSRCAIDQGPCCVLAIA